MLDDSKKRTMTGTLCVCCCCAVILGIVGVVYYEKSRLDIKHECEIYTVNTRLCQFSCGQICHRRMTEALQSAQEDYRPYHRGYDSDTYSPYYDSDTTDSWTGRLQDNYYHSGEPDTDSDSDSDTGTSSSSSHHCHTRYCWGFEYLYRWQTMDWKYQPYDVHSAVVAPDNSHGYIESPFMDATNMSSVTEKSLKALLQFLDDNDLREYEDDILQLNLSQYVEHMHDTRHMHADDMHAPIASFLLHTLREMNDTLSAPHYNNSIRPHAVTSCDYKRPAYITYGTCARWPAQWHSLADQQTCYSNDRCSAFTTLSPALNLDLADGFGFSSVACLAIFALIAMYWMLCCMYRRLCGYHRYEAISDSMQGEDDYMPRKKSDDDSLADEDDRQLPGLPVLVAPVVVDERAMYYLERNEQEYPMPNAPPQSMVAPGAVADIETESGMAHEVEGDAGGATGVQHVMHVDQDAWQVNGRQDRNVNGFDMLNEMNVDQNVDANNSFMHR